MPGAAAVSLAFPPTAAARPPTVVLDEGVDIAAGRQLGWRWVVPSELQVAELAVRLDAGPPQATDTGWEAGGLTVGREGQWEFTCTEDAAACGVGGVDVGALATRAFSTADVTVTGTGTDAVAVATYLADGEPTGQRGYANFAGARGVVGTPERLGPYPTLSAANAVGRLQALWAADLAQAPAGAEVRITEVSVVSVGVVDAGGVAWSLPGYRYRDATGSSWEVLAVVNTFLAGKQGSFTAGDPDPTNGKPGIVPPVLGLAEPDAFAHALDNGYTPRVAERDGVVLPGTRDYDPTRLNLVVVDGRVRSVYVG